MIRKLTNKELDKHFGHREDHEYRHFNRSLGVFVEGKEHFRQLLSTGKYIPYDLAEQYAEDYDKKNPRAPIELSAKARDIINSIKLTADRHGNIKLGNRAIRALQEIGAIPSQPIQEQLERIYREDTLRQGGFGKATDETFSVNRKE
jgi:hypothetical protein